MHTPYTIQQSRRDLRKKNTYIHITRCALSALQRPPAEGNRPADMARHTRHPGFEQPGARPDPPYYERTLSECAMSPHGRAARRETRPRCCYRWHPYPLPAGALLLPLAPLAAPAEIKTMATLRLRDRRENDVILRGPAAIIAQAM